MAVVNAVTRPRVCAVTGKPGYRGQCRSDVRSQSVVTVEWYAYGVAWYGDVVCSGWAACGRIQVVKGVVKRSTHSVSHLTALLTTAKQTLQLSAMCTDVDTD